MNKLNGKQIGENIGIFFLCLGLVMVLTPTLKMIAYLGSVVF